MGNNDIKVKDLSTTSSLSTDNKLMLLTDEANNTVQNITVENALANIISSNANNSLSIGTDKKLYSSDISGEVGDLDNLITTNKTDIVSAINEVKGDTNAITGSVVPASKGWLEEGEIYQKANWYGEKLYNNVYTYNHSTNITGIDTIKPADYTVVGSPTISTDGIVSGITGANYIKTNYEIGNLAGKSYTIYCRWIKSGATFSQSENIYGFGTGYPNVVGGIYLLTNRKVALADNGTRLIEGITQFTTTVNYIDFKLERDVIAGTYTLYSNIGNGWINEGTSNLSTDLSSITSSPTNNICFYRSWNYNGSIDLNAFKIYVNGDLVYQPCLLIPYNESSTGSKIVDVAYRDRVIDVFEQLGSANYYTIDEVNQNATQPMGEIYGFIRQSDSDKIYKAIVPCYDSTKAISVPLLGNYTAPADGYVCSPNMVLTLDPDNGYENFSLTIMRNTQSMTMISCTGPTAFPFCLPVLKDDVLTLAADATVTSNVYFIPREGV